jgi:hypothetical protein
VKLTGKVETTSGEQAPQAAAFSVLPRREFAFFCVCGQVDSAGAEGKMLIIQVTF